MGIVAFASFLETLNNYPWVSTFILPSINDKQCQYGMFAGILQSELSCDQLEFDRRKTL